MADVSSSKAAGASTTHSTSTDSTPFGLLIGLTLLLLLAFALKCLLYLSNSTTALRGAVRTATSRLKLRQYQRPPLRGIATEEDECEEVMEEREVAKVPMRIACAGGLVSCVLALVLVVTVARSALWVLADGE